MNGAETHKKLREFTESRCQKMFLNQEMTHLFNNKQALVIHLLNPYADSDKVLFDVDDIVEAASCFIPSYKPSKHIERITMFDGVYFLVKDDKVRAYTLVFRDGTIEAVFCPKGDFYEEYFFVDGKSMFHIIAQTLILLVHGVKRMELANPCYFQLHLIGFSGTKLALKDGDLDKRGRAGDRDLMSFQIINLQLDTLSPEFDKNIVEYFRMICNAFNHWRFPFVKKDGSLDFDLLRWK